MLHILFNEADGSALIAIGLTTVLLISKFNQFL